MTPGEINLQTWNKVAQVYHDKFMPLTLYDASYDAFIACISANKARILDVGCGPGNITYYLGQKRPDWILEGIDAAPNMVAIAAKNLPGAAFSVLDCRDLDRLETQYHGVVCGFCLPYLEPAAGEKLLNDIYQRLIPGGYLYLSFVPGDPGLSGYQTGSTGDRTYFHYYDMPGTRHVLERLGYQIVSEMTIQYPEELGGPADHAVLIGRKGK